MTEAERPAGKSKSAIEEEIDVIAQRILSEIQTATTRELQDDSYAKMILRSSDIDYVAGKPERKDGYVPTGPQREIEKMAVIKALLLSTWSQRLYFIIRSVFMSIIGAVIAFAFVIHYGSLNWILLVLSGLSGFIVALLTTRLFDEQIDRATRKIISALASHRALRDFILDHF
jgi:hypothetical protein